MKRMIPLLLAVAGGNAIAQDDRLEHVLVSVPIHKKSAETALPVIILSGDELQRQAAATIGETLGRMPGIANSSFGPGVGRPVIRGQQGPRAVVLLNGTSGADVSSLSPDHAVAVEPMLADSIEVLRGPATLLYGGGAIGGVVNIIDSRIPRTAIDGVEGSVEYRYDDAADMDTGVARIDAGNGKFSWHLSGTTRDYDDLDIPGKAIDEKALEAQEELLGGEHGEEHEEEELENSDGYIANTDGDFDNVTAGFSFHFGERGYTGFAVSHLETKYGIPPGAHGHHEDDDHEGDEHADEDHEEEGHEEEHDEEEHGEEDVRIDLEQTRYDAQLHIHDLAGGSVEVLRAFLTYTDYEHQELEGAEVGTEFDRDTWETRVEVVHEPMLGFHGVLGFQWQEDEFSAIGDEAYVPETDSSAFGVFLVEDYHSGNWTFELGARGDYVERDPDATNAGSEDFTSLSLAGSALWRVSQDWRLGASLSRSSRAPSTEELFSNVDADRADQLVVHAATGVIEVGDANLDEELSNNLDLSINWEGERSWASLSLFYNVFEDYIFLFNTGEEEDESPIYAYRQDDADFAGFELESDWFLTDVWSGELRLGVTADYVVAEFDEGGDVPRLPPFRVGSELLWQDGNLTTWVKVMNAGDQDDPGDFETQTDGYTRWDAGIEYRLEFGESSELMTFLKWKNIGDDEIRLSTSFLRNYAPEAGESVEAGIRYSF